VIEQMLTNMFLGNPPGTTDRILEFSTAVTGNLFFAPTAAFLDDPPAPGGPAEPIEDEVVQPGEASSHGSLGIGGLRGDG